VQQVEQAREVLDTWVRSAGAEAEGLLALREGVEGGGGGGRSRTAGGERRRKRAVVRAAARCCCVVTGLSLSR